MAAFWKGKKLSSEHCRKISDALKEYNKRRRERQKLVPPELKEQKPMRIVRTIYAMAIIAWSGAMIFMVFHVWYGRIELPTLSMPMVKLPGLALPEVSVPEIKVPELAPIELPKLPEISQPPAPERSPIVVLGSAWSYAEPTSTIAAPSPTSTPARRYTNTPKATSTPAKPTATPVNVLQVNTATRTPTPSPTPVGCTWVTVDGKTILVSEEWLIEHGYPTWPGCSQ
ncbi:MAG: hypothetical protein C4534_08155 [Gaiellales bacterium]|nr:MAG: hypothetical protein C4534_08155 [Gaiellales bacterium]